MHSLQVSQTFKYYSLTYRQHNAACPSFMTQPSSLHLSLKKLIPQLIFAFKLSHEDTPKKVNPFMMQELQP